MPISVITHTRFNWQEQLPTAAQPLVMFGRDLSSDTNLQAHRHPWGQLTYVVDGVIRVMANDSSWIVPPHRAIWIAPEIEHAVTVLEPVRLRPLYVHAGRAPFAGSQCRVVEVSALLRELMAALAQPELDQQSARALLLGEMILDELSRSAVAPIRVPLPRDKRLNALCQALLADPGAELTLADWSGRVGASPRTLTRLFERELGMSFGQWRQQVRLAEAAALITRGLPLSQVAAQLGYASQSAFSAMFKKTFGSAPTAFFRQK